MTDFTAAWTSRMMDNYGTPRIELVKGEGPWLTDSEGKRYLDLLAGIAVNVLGHGNPAIVDAVSKQVAELGHVSNIFASEPPLKLAEKLIELTGWGAEDTRVTGKLLASFGISCRMERLDENTVGQRAAAIVERVLSGEVIAYCTDAGMPGVSDPGQRLVAAARAAGAPVEVLPGPTATATAYVASGFTCPRFYFGGFFPRKEGQRAETLAALQSLDAVLLFYESPHRIVAALRAVAESMPYRQVAVCRELTKLHEEVAIGTAQELAEAFAEREAAGGVKGEIVLVIDAPSE